ncbi:hypothetical protein J5X84_24225 [Streptosporangiaceae bacterium NEAU-GS5]|nr:hypothetical protein [Streptosporangiaceae bacterium NEAU-GS5]
MKGDFTRRTFRGENHYRSVLLQQGRVALDADWNEQADIQAHHDETTARDLIGGDGGPRDGAGFAVTDAEGGAPKACPPKDLRLSPGRFYVGGVLCENEQPVPLAAQPDLPGVALPTAKGRYVAYLDVWREHLTAVERPELREVALGGPDTATRTRTVWQVRLRAVPRSATAADVTAGWDPDAGRSTARLRARAQAPADSAGPCVIPDSAGYRRLENQLYRVEIRNGGAGPAYVWSRDNATVVARLTDLGDGVLTIDRQGRDALSGFAAGDLIEVVGLAATRRGEQGVLGHVTKADGTRLWVTWPEDAPVEPDGVTLVRRWDCADAAPVADGWLDLEDGVQVQFDLADLGGYRTADYWTIPARTAATARTDLDPDLAGDVEWPVGPDGPSFVAPEGIRRRSAVIALLDLAGGAWSLVADCRALFTPLAQVPPPAAPSQGPHVARVVLDAQGTDLVAGTRVTAEDLTGGVSVILDGDPDGSPALTLTLDLPYPLLPSERREWGLADDSAEVFGTRPLELAAAVTVSERRIAWRPVDPDGAANVGRVLAAAGRLTALVRCRLAADVAGFALSFSVAPPSGPVTGQSRFDAALFDQGPFAG